MKKYSRYFVPLISWKQIKFVKIAIWEDDSFSTKIYLREYNNNTKDYENFWDIKIMCNACLSGEWKEITGQEAVLIV